MLEHGGNLGAAIAAYGHDRSDWLDLSTGLNPRSYPAPPIAADIWHRLPERSPQLHAAACRYYGVSHLLVVAGSQAAIQALPRLRAHSRVSVAAPVYAEHAYRWRQAGHEIREVAYAQLGAAIADSDVVVVCNPNNPTGAMVDAQTLLGWAAQLAERGGWLVVDEAFIDVDAEQSLARHAASQPGLIVLRSLGKFFGLAGLRMGFVVAEVPLLQRLDDEIGPWGVTTAAQLIAGAALADEHWQRQTRRRLQEDDRRLRELLGEHSIDSSGSALFQWWQDARADQFVHHMALRAIWVRKFDQRVGSGLPSIRLGLPPDESGWSRLRQALGDWVVST
jgi:cobalamin biosynthetic protein CobC